MNALPLKPLDVVTLEDAIDFCDNLDELEITNKRGEVKHLEEGSAYPILLFVR